MGTSNSTIVFEDIPPTSILMDPALFASWWRDGLTRKKLRPLDLAVTLEKSGTPIAFVRASQVLARDPQHLVRAVHLAGRALRSDDAEVRLLARVRLGTLEAMRGYRLGARDTRGSPSAIPLLIDLLEVCAQTSSQTDLVIEAEMRTRKALGETMLMVGNYIGAQTHLAHALAIAEGFGLESFAHHVEFLMGVVLFHNGKIAQSNARLKQVATNVRAEDVYVKDASLMIAMNALWQGDDTRAISVLESMRHDAVVFGLYADCALAITGRGGQETDPNLIRHWLPNELALTFQAYQLLLQANARRRTKESDERYRALRTLLEDFRTTTPWLEAECGFLRCLASLRLGEIGLSAQQFPAPDNVQPEHAAVRALLLGVGLELGLRYLGNDVRPVAELTRQLQGLLLESNPSVRQSLADRFSVFLPLAGAFLAFSPYSVPEFLSGCGPAVINVRAKPITVFGMATLRPVHAVRYTLEAFGYPEMDYRDGGGQLEAEEAALHHLHGSRHHWFTPISPALLTFQFIRQHELFVGSTAIRSPSVWFQAALDLSQMHGLVPIGARGFLERERHALERALKPLLRGEMSVEGFRAQLRAVF